MVSTRYKPLATIRISSFIFLTSYFLRAIRHPSKKSLEKIPPRRDHLRNPDSQVCESNQECLGGLKPYAAQN